MAATTCVAESITTTNATSDIKVGSNTAYTGTTHKVNATPQAGDLLVLLAENGEISVTATIGATSGIAVDTGTSLNDGTRYHWYFSKVLVAGDISGNQVLCSVNNHTTGTVRRLTAVIFRDANGNGFSTVVGNRLLNSASTTATGTTDALTFSSGGYAVAALAACTQASTPASPGHTYDWKNDAGSFIGAVDSDQPGGTNTQAVSASAKPGFVGSTGYDTATTIACTIGGIGSASNRIASLIAYRTLNTSRPNTRSTAGAVSRQTPKTAVRQSVYTRSSASAVVKVLGSTLSASSNNPTFRSSSAAGYKGLIPYIGPVATFPQFRSSAASVARQPLTHTLRPSNARLGGATAMDVVFVKTVSHIKTRSISSGSARSKLPSLRQTRPTLFARAASVARLTNSKTQSFLKSRAFGSAGSKLQDASTTSAPRVRSSAASSSKNVLPIPVAIVGESVLAGVGNLSATGNIKRIGVASLSGSGQISASGFHLAIGAAQLSGVGQLNANGQREVMASATLLGVSDLFAIGGVQDQSLAVLRGFGYLDAIGHHVISGQAYLTGQGSLTASGLRGRRGTAILIGQNQVVADGRPRVRGFGILRGASGLAASGFRFPIGAAVLLGRGIISAIATRRARSAATIAGVGSLTASATRRVKGIGLVQGAGSVSANGTVIDDGKINGFCVMAASGNVTALAKAKYRVRATLRGVGGGVLYFDVDQSPPAAPTFEQYTYTIVLDTSLLVDGQSVLVVSASDEAGNVGDVELPIYLLGDPIRTDDVVLTMGRIFDAELEMSQRYEGAFL